MSQVSNEYGWMTSFIYKQDLTSYYMNNVLSGVFRPGVYNANLALVFEGSKVYLSIKKGTTLLFSNNYMICGNNGTRRNFSETSKLEFHKLDTSQPEAEDLILIKCVAQYDIYQELFNLGDQILPNNKEIFIYSYIKYERSSKNDSVPLFRVASSNQNDRNGEEANNFMYITMKSAEYSMESPYLFPDGCNNYDIENTSKKLKDYSFLMLGVVSCIDDRVGQNTNPDIYKYITFTGRGLPEYRYSMLSENSVMTPSLIIDQRTSDNLSHLCKNSYLDMPDTLISDILYNQRILNGDYEDYEDLSWEQFFDNKCHIVEDIPENYPKTNFNISTDLSDLRRCVVLDFIFGKVNSTEVESNEISFSNSKSSISLDKETVVYSVDDSSEFNSFNYYSDSYWFTVATGKTDDNYRVVPLDICERNIERLSKLIRNKNLWEQVINKYRMHNNMSNSGKTTDIIPMAIAFRPFSTEEEDNIGVSGAGSGILPAADNLYTVSYLDTKETVNPINVLSYFDLLNKKGKANILNINTSNIYNQIPIR